MKTFMAALFTVFLLPGVVIAAPEYAVTEISKVVYWSKGKQPLKDYRLVLDDFANELKDNELLSLQISGYADPSREKKKAQRLSTERALWAKEYIVSKGIDADRISIVGLGDEDPVYSGKQKRESAKNRRVELNLIENEK